MGFKGLFQKPAPQNEQDFTARLQKNRLQKKVGVQVVGIPCGNVWPTLSGDNLTQDAERHCQQCDRKVLNLAMLTPKQIDHLLHHRREAGRQCVVYENPTTLKGWLRFGFSAACALLSTISFLQGASAEEGDTLKTLPACQTYLYTPMVMIPDRPCQDEQGTPTTFEKWQHQELPKIEAEEQKHNPDGLPVEVIPEPPAPPEVPDPSS